MEVEKILAKMYPKFEESWFTRECQKLHLPEGKQFKEFSNGMKAKLRVLTALSHKAQLLILDVNWCNKIAVYRVYTVDVE